MQFPDRSACPLLALLGILSLSAQAQVDAIYDEGSNALLRQLSRLQTTASVLHTGAHPDDEDSALVAYHARRDHARTAYLSLTRGSGGQNIIGAEQSDALGVIRTEELLQARRLDGAQQFFTRANDFGFSKYRAEAARIWPQDELLGDMVRTIRQFRPDVVVSRFSGTPADGHGHHQFAGYLTPLAIEAAADPARFTEQIDEGLLAWQVSKLYVSVRSDPDLTDDSLLRINTGEYDPVTGNSFYEIGMQGRSQQKTQQMGSLELRGDQYSLLQLRQSTIAAETGETSVFDGIDTTISGLARFEAAPADEFLSQAEQLDGLNAALLANYDPINPVTLIAELARGREMALSLRSLSTAAESRRLLDEKIAEYEQAMVLAAGVRIDALADSETLVPGSSTLVAVRIYLADNSAATFLSARLEAPSGWSVAPADQPQLDSEAGARRQDSADQQAMFRVDLPPSATITQPYWLVQPRPGAAYDWSAADDARTHAFSAPILMATVLLEIGGVELAVRKEAEFRALDRVRGELRRRIDVVPRVSVEPASDLLVIPVQAGAQAAELLLTVRNLGTEPVAGTAQFNLPQSWALAPAFREFSLAPAPASTTLSFSVTLPPGVEPGEYHLQANALIDGQVFAQAMEEIAYSHINTHRLYANAETEIEVVDVAVAPVHVGYVMGSGDLVPESLRRLGLQVSLLSDAELTTGELSRYDVIVIGIRASQTRPAFVANNQRLLDFAQQGGTLIVQYQQPDFAAQNLAPFPVSMDRNVRVVDETAAVTILQPDHPVFNFPNQITQLDFEGWVQERNNYNFTSFDRERYVPLTEAHDEGEPNSDGAMLYLKMGDGHYIYTAYSWFRQLPNGIPGAYRIFANLLSLPALIE